VRNAIWFLAATAVRALTAKSLNIAYERLILNQCCSLGRPKSFLQQYQPAADTGDDPAEVSRRDN
jgi:hypothetical protein